MLQLLRIGLLLLLLAPQCFASVNIREEDGSPDTYPWQLRVTNGALTDNGDGTASLSVVGAETDPIVGAVTGIVKADGGGNISAATDGTDYLSSTTGLKLDQTTPQTISNGLVLYDDAHPAFTESHQIVDKEYVDEAVTAINLNYYMLDSDSGVSDYKDTQITIPSAAEANDAHTVTANDQYLRGWISPSGGSLTALVSGIYSIYLEAKVDQVTGYKRVKLYWTLVEYKTDTSEVVIATSEDSDQLTVTQADYTIHLALASDYTLTAGSRIVGKIYADLSGTGNDPTATLYYLGAINSRWAVPSSTEVLDTLYLGISDNAVSATALAADPTDCSANNFATTIAASGNLTCAQVADSYIDTGADVLKAAFGVTIDGGGAAITTGVKGYVTVPYAMTVTGWDILADQSGSIVVDVWKDTYANFPPTVADTIAGSEKPTISAATKGQDASLSTWTTSVTAGDIIGFNVDSAATVTRVTVIIYGRKT